MKANWEWKYGVRGSRRWRDALQLGDMSPSRKAATCRRTPKFSNSFKSPLRHVPVYNSNNKNLKFFRRSSLPTRLPCRSLVRSRVTRKSSIMRCRVQHLQQFQLLQSFFFFLAHHTTFIALQRLQIGQRFGTANRSLPGNHLRQVWETHRQSEIANLSKKEFPQIVRFYFFPSRPLRIHATRNTQYVPPYKSVIIPKVSCHAALA